MTRFNDENLSKDWLEAELEEILDEDAELELEDALLSMEIKKIYQAKHHDTISRKAYFVNLLKLQAELIKLNDWVQDTQAKVVVLFEGRYSAGKGGVIKRITQRLNPRVCRVVALPKPTFPGKSFRKLLKHALNEVSKKTLQN